MIIGGQTSYSAGKMEEESQGGQSFGLTVLVVVRDKWTGGGVEEGQLK